MPGCPELLAVPGTDLALCTSYHITVHLALPCSEQTWSRHFVCILSPSPQNAGERYELLRFMGLGNEVQKDSLPCRYHSWQTIKSGVQTSGSGSKAVLRISAPWEMVSVTKFQPEKHRGRPARTETLKIPQH